ncbi:hypothetical protein R1sor_021586 [Riccia sorocarpa]|uniref:Uncharacterized protein n=1 Tax=Riccia sorocarpa TaxID=122646 RepID=A0ABD3GHG1_9MARC
MMESLVDGRLSSCGFPLVARSSLKEDRKMCSLESILLMLSVSSNLVEWKNFIFRWQKDEPLTVDWSNHLSGYGTVLWFAAFSVMGSWIIPLAAQLAGFSRHSLSFRGQALYSLIPDIAEGTVGIWILRRYLARFVPFPDGWFHISLN